MSEDMETLATALPREMKRVREELVPMYQSIGPSGGFALLMMNQALTKAEQAMAGGDVVEMLRAYKELEGFTG